MAAMVGAMAGAQTPAQPPVPANPAAATPPAGQTSPNAPAPSAAQLFPFPEEDSKTKSLTGAHPVPAAPAPDAPAPGAGSPAANDAAKKFPYPGDNAPAAPDGSGYSSSGDSTPGNPAPGSTPDAPVRKKLELEDAGSAGRVDTARADKDEQVADFYIKDGNYAGAYLRYKDAVIFDPDNADAHFGLAGMARRKGKTDEAIAEYGAVLKLEPQGKHAKEARKAIAELQAKK